MSAPAKREVDLATRSAQQRASDPAASAWVSANAGSGKTHVLTQRVLRLLLDGADPAAILCLTFTKAAAANMSTRVFRELSRWTALNDDELRKAILATGADSAPATKLDFARRLFARAIETPGGLKIQTIHAFCERVLHRFPFEANVAAGFRVIEEREANDLLQQAREAAFLAAEQRPDLAAAFDFVATEAGPDKFDALMTQTLKRREDIAGYGEPEAYARRLRRSLGLRDDETLATIRDVMLNGGPSRAHWKRWAEALRQGSANDAKLGAKLTAAAASSDPALLRDIYLDVFFIKNGEGTPRAKMVNDKLDRQFPELKPELEQEQARLEALRDRERAANAVERSCALLIVARAVLERYAAAKNARGWLDFDDLIARTLALTENANAAWVLYKLDRAIDHILVDEAQDTSRAQWRILEKLADEFLSGGESGRKRSFFAVGDEKQSIFSFQGAEPALFDAMRRIFKRRHEEAERRFHSVQLLLSFRSSPRVLDAVDKVFETEVAWRGVSAGETQAPRHGAHHVDLPGLVELWPTLRPAPTTEPEDWRMPLDAQAQRGPAARLAERIAQVIAGWLSPESRERVIDAQTRAPRRIRAGDILILVRSRGGFFEAMTRALRRARAPFAGADRMILRDHIAVLDLVAAGRAALNEDDDLALACALKSPLIGLDDEALLELAPERPASLSAALAGSRFLEAAAKAACWRERARELSPFDFYARLIGADGGRRALIGRLGPEAGDAIDEFLALALDFERNDSPSLSSFLDEVEASEASIKRDMEAEGGGVRVMTAHAAKGLEAPIVFLPDTCGAPTGRHDPNWLELEAALPQSPALRFWSLGKDHDSARIAAAREASRAIGAGEHRRLLYVAMTRAAQRLIVAGFEGEKERPPECWYDLILGGLGGALEEAPAPWSPAETIRRWGAPPTSGDAEAPAVAISPAPAPAWLDAPAPAEAEAAALTPSRARARASEGEGSRGREALEIGRLAHALLQYLPDVAPERRAEAAQAFLERSGHAVAPERRPAIAESALSLFGRAELAPLFGPASRAEVAFAGRLRLGSGEREIAGRIDRLAEVGDTVWIADFKTGARPRGGHAPDSYLAQLALYSAALKPIYPEKSVKAALIWLESGEIDWLDAAQLEAALVTMGAAP